eukprot:3998199-Pleurochrysis_carterae.AAC.2
MLKAAHARMITRSHAHACSRLRSHGLTHTCPHDQALMRALRARFRAPTYTCTHARTRACSYPRALMFAHACTYAVSAHDFTLVRLCTHVPRLASSQARSLAGKICAARMAVRSHATRARFGQELHTVFVTLFKGCYCCMRIPWVVSGRRDESFNSNEQRQRGRSQVYDTVVKYRNLRASCSLHAAADVSLSASAVQGFDLLDATSPGF